MNSKIQNAQIRYKKKKQKNVQYIYEKKYKSPLNKEKKTLIRKEKLAEMIPITFFYSQLKFPKCPSIFQFIYFDQIWD